MQRAVGWIFNPIDAYELLNARRDTIFYETQSMIFHGNIISRHLVLI